MKTKLFLLLTFLTVSVSWGQINIVAGGTATENFNSLGASSTASLPTGWKAQKTTYVRDATLSYSTAATAVELAGGNNIANTATGGIYRFNADSVTTESSLGGISSSSASKTVAFMSYFNNNAATTISSFTISYNVEKFRGGNNTAGFTIDLLYSTNGTTWTSCGAPFITSFTADASTAGYTLAPTTSTAVSGTYTPSGAIPQNSKFYFAWRYSVTSATTTSNAQALGFDDISITAVGAGTTPPTLTADTSLNTVDNNLDIAFTDTPAWQTAITAVKIGTTTLTPTTDYTITAGNIQLKPSGNAILQSAGTKTVTVVATGYANATVSQVINAGAPTTNSTAAISAALAVGASRTITCTAKDQYNNLVSGYTFAYDVSVTNANSTTVESYTIDGTAFATTSTTGNPVTATTNASGVASFTAVLPATIDAADGVSVQVQLANDTTNVGTAFSFTQLASQTITFNALSAVTYGDAPLALTATASSGLAVTYISSNPAIASMAGNTVTFLSNGSVTITASQAGDASFNAAPNVQQTLTINQKTLTVNGAVATDKIYNTNTTATISGTLVGIVGADVVTFVGTNNGVFASADVGTAIAVTSNAVLGGANASKYLLTQPTGLTASITQAPQTINFAALSDRTMGDAPFSVVATSATSATSALTYSSSNTAVATISAAGLITIVGIGTTTITVAQAGNSNYTAATNQDRTLLVKAVPIVAWQLNGKAGDETSVNAGTIDTNLNSTTLIRGSGLRISAFGNAFSSTNYTASGTKAGEFTANKFISFTLNAKTGYKVSLSTLDVRLRRSSNGPNNYRWQYALDGTTFTDLGTADVNFTNTSTDGVSQTQLSLSAIPELQNVGYATTITFRLVAWGATNTTGTFAIGRSLATIITNPSDYSLQIGGTVTVKDAVWQSGAWSNTVGPDASLDAVIKDVYTVPTNGTFIAKKLTVDGAGSFTANAGSTVTLTDNLVNSLTADKVVFNSSASLMQNSTLANPNAITYKRATASLAHDFDVVYLGSPLENPTLASAWMTTANDTFYSFNTALAGGQNWETAAPTATMDPAKGFIARAVLGSPGWTTLGTSYTMSFVGKPNNGNYNFTIVKDGTANVHNLLANPYPSALDLIAFSTDTDNSSKLTGNYYFWINNTAVAANNTYANNDYATYNVNINAGTGVGNPAATGGTTPTQYVAAGQAFFTEAAAAGPVTFKNTHRVAGNNNTFYRTSAQPASLYSDKVWLNLSNNQAAFKQQIIAYTQQATTAFDTNFDAKTFDGNPSIDFYSIIPSAKFTIQSRPVFNANDVVALGFRTTTAGTFQINIDHADGVFANGQRVYLQDNLLGLDFDITTAAYSFTTQAGTFDNRFVLKYTSALSTNATVYDNSILVTANKNVLKISSSMEDMAAVSIFDLLGREVYTKAINAKDFIASNLATNQQVMVVKITLTNGVVVTKKIIL